MRVTAYLGKSLFCRKRRFMVHRKKTQINKSLSTFSCNAQHIHVHAGGTSVLHSRWRKPHAIWKPTIVKKRTAQIPRHETYCHDEDGSCSWAKFKIIITAKIPGMNHVSPYTCLEQLPKSLDNERYVTCGECPSHAANPMLYS